MSSTGVTLGYGVTVEIGSGDPVAFVTLVGVDDVDFPAGEADEVEVTHMQSPGRAKEFIQGLFDNGTVDVPLHWVPGSTTDLLLNTLKTSGDIIQVRFGTPGPNSFTETFAGFVKSYARSAPVQDKMMATAGLRINGPVA